MSQRLTYDEIMAMCEEQEKPSPQFPQGVMVEMLIDGEWVWIDECGHLPKDWRQKISGDEFFDFLIDGVTQKVEYTKTTLRDRWAGERAARRYLRRLRREARRTG